jgi:4-carboxymuconolactone decarboxylase
MIRIQDLKSEELTSEQKRLFDEIARPRHGTVRGPFAIWLRTPAIADHANKFGNALRLNGKLDKRLFELMTLVVARDWTAQYEWFAQERNAREAGLGPDIIASIKEGNTPKFAQDNERVVFDVTKELLATKSLSDSTYTRAAAVLGLDLLIELVTGIGFYTMVAMMLNAFEVPVPGGASPLAPKAEAETMRPVRRVVTGHDVKQVAKVLVDAPATNTRHTTGANSTLIWCTDQTPADLAIGEDFEDMGARQLGTPPPANGTRFAVNDFPPGNTARMHRTETLDYVIVLSGEIDMDTGTKVVGLKAGDVVIQRGTDHAWINRGTEPARVAFILIDAKPLGIGHAVKSSV